VLTLALLATGALVLPVSITRSSPASSDPVLSTATAGSAVSSAFGTLSGRAAAVSPREVGATLPPPSFPPAAAVAAAPAAPAAVAAAAAAVAAVAAAAAAEMLSKCCCCCCRDSASWL